MTTLAQATIIVLIVLITCWVLAKATTPPKRNITVVKDVQANCAPTNHQNQLNAHLNNTTTQRPGTAYDMQINDHVRRPAYVIRLLYRPGNEHHPLFMLFKYLQKEMSSQELDIEFQMEFVDVTNPYNLYSGFPKIIKIRRDGQVLEYKGYSDYAQLHDWVLNEGIRF